MAYRCLGCGNRSLKKFPQGRCPACRSYNVESDSSLGQELYKRPQWRLRDATLLLVLLLCLAYGVAGSL